MYVLDGALVSSPPGSSAIVVAGGRARGRLRRRLDCPGPRWCGTRRRNRRAHRRADRTAVDALSRRSRCPSISSAPFLARVHAAVVSDACLRPDANIGVGIVNALVVLTTSSGARDALLSPARYVIMVGVNGSAIAAAVFVTLTAGLRSGRRSPTTLTSVVGACHCRRHLPKSPLRRSPSPPSTTTGLWRYTMPSAC